MWSKSSTMHNGSPTSESPANSPPPPARRIKNPGRRIAQIVKLKPEYIARYKEVHAAVWPEVLKQIKVCNIEDCEYMQKFSFFGGIAFNNVHILSFLFLGNT